jgi:Phospholipase_D-nuclease N-terminal
MDALSKYVPLLIPLVIVQLGLMVFGLMDLIPREKLRGPKWAWILIVIFVNIFGPIIYFLFGRKEE